MNGIRSCRGTKNSCFAQQNVSLAFHARFPEEYILKSVCAGAKWLFKLKILGKQNFLKANFPQWSKVENISSGDIGSNVLVIIC